MRSDAPAMHAADTADAETAARPADAMTRRSRALALASVVGLIVVGLAWELWLAPTGRGTWAIKVLPLCFTLTGVWRYRMRTYRVLSLLLWLYVAEAAVRVSTESGVSATLAGAQLGLSLLLFVACALHVRWRLMHRSPP